MFFKKIKLLFKSFLNSATLIKILIGLIILGAFFYINIKTIDPDLGWHLRVGQTIFSDRAIPRFDQFSFTMNGFSWVDHEWLVDALLWQSYSKNLWWIVIIIFTLVSFVPFFSWLKRACSIYSLTLILLIATALIQVRFLGIRPQMLSFFLFWLVFEILFKHYWPASTNSSSKKRLLFLPLIFLFWANLHAGFASGLMLFGLLIFGSYLSWLRQKIKNCRSQKFEITIFFLSLLATLVNPYGIQLYKEILSVLFSANTAKYIAEWQSLFAFGSLYYIGMILAVILFALVKNYKKYPFGIFLAAALFLLSFLKSIRMIIPFLVISVPLTLYGIELVKKDIFRARAAKPFSPKETGSIKIAGWAALAIVLIFFIWELTHYHFFLMPEKSALFLQKYLQQQNSARNVLNDYAWGGYLLWKIPGSKIFIDGRMPHWQDKNGISAMEDYVKIFSTDNSVNWQGILKKWQITEIIMPNPSSENGNTNSITRLRIKLKSFFPESAAINQFLFPASTQDKRNIIEKTLRQNGWEIIYQDQVAVVLSCGNCEH